MRVGEAVAEALRAQGVDTAFGLLGEGNLAVLEHLTALPGVAWHASRREDAAVCMADGRARRAGAVGFATVTHGPGVANAVIALTEAAKARTPLVVLAGDTAREDHRHPQAVDERSFVAPTGAGVHDVRSAATAVEDVAIAFERARRERRPVVLILPVDLADAPYSGPPPAPPVSPARPPRVLPDEQAVGEALAVLAAAERPVVLAGRGAVAAREPLAALAHALGAPLVTTLLARGLFAGDPLEAGMAGGFGSDLANALLAEADAVLAAGTSLDSRTTKDGALLDGARVVHVDVEPAAGVAVAGDAAATSQALLEGLGAGSARRRAAVAERIAAAPRPADHSGAAGLDPRAVAAAVGEALPAERTVVVDLGYFTAEACRHVGVPGPGRFVLPLYFGSIGLALATAAGAATVAPEAPTVALVGDGGLMLAVGELDTLRRLGLPVVVVVFNDSAYGIEHHALRLRGRDTRLAAFEDVDFAAVARGFGIEAASVRTAAELRGLRDLLRDPRGPLLVDARIDRAIETEWLGELVAAGWPHHG